MPENRELEFSINSSAANASYILSQKIASIIKASISSYLNIVIFCIGTDRSTGDCLGPLVGYKLSCSHFSSNIHIFGTLSEPVHAKNLEEKISFVYRNFESPFIMAVDASLGKCENVGNVNLYRGPLYPGAGVNKELIPVGDISLTGIVNISGFMEYIVLQNTRLSIVMKIADTISQGISMALLNVKDFCAEGII